MNCAICIPSGNAMTIILFCVFFSPHSQSGEAETGAGVPLHRGAGWAAVIQHGRHCQSQREARQVPHPQKHCGPNPADQTAWAGWGERHTWNVRKTCTDFSKSGMVFFSLRSTLWQVCNELSLFRPDRKSGSPFSRRRCAEERHLVQ